MTLILRLSIDTTGRVNGVVERVRTGEKHRFLGAETLLPLIAEMVRAEAGRGAVVLDPAIAEREAHRENRD